jgi:hypothetical protein
MTENVIQCVLEKKKINTCIDQVKMSLVFRNNEYLIKVVFLLALVLMERECMCFIRPRDGALR